MSIRRAPRRDSYTILDNRLINDPALDFAALGALVYLLSKPDDWTVRMSEMGSRGRIGRRALGGIMERLTEAGYATLETLRSKDGKRAAGSAWTVSELPDLTRCGSHGTRESQNVTLTEPRPLLSTDALPKTETSPTTKNVKVKTPRPPTPPAGQPDDQGAERTAPARATGRASRAAAERSAGSPRASTPSGDPEARGGRWHGVATAIMAALGRPEPLGKLPTWLGNTVRVFGAAAGDDPAVAASLVQTWARSTALQQAMAGGYLRDHTVPSLAGQWIATTGKRYGAVAPAGADPVAERMKAMGAPENWRDLVYAPGGVKRAPQLALPRMGLEPYAKPADWPAWYRAFEGVDA